MEGVRRAVRGEPWHYQMSLALLIGMVLAHRIGGSTSGAFVIFILVTIGWFLLYGFAMVCEILARVDNEFWDWFTEQGPG